MKEEKIKLLKVYRDDEEPYPCDACDDEWNGFNVCLISLFKGFNVWVALCDDCFKKLKKELGIK